MTHSESDSPVPVSFPHEAVRADIFSSNETVQARFQTEFPEQIQRAITGIAAAHRALDIFRARLSPSLQTATLELFFHSGVHAVLCSVHHLVSGFPIAAGNMMRHYTESVAMALLCLDPQLGVLAEYTRSRKTYPIHKAPTRLRQRQVRAVLKAKIAFDEEAWETVLEIAQLYEQLSHASALSLGLQLMLNTEHGMILGGEYDPAKREPYRADLVRRASAAESLGHLITVVTNVLTSEAAQPALAAGASPGRSDK